MTDKQIIIDDQKKTIHRLQDECTEKTNAIIALGEQLEAKEQECEELKGISMKKCPKCGEVYLNSVGMEAFNQLDQLKAQLLDQEAETLKAGGIIHKLEKTLTEIKEFFNEECIICKENYINITGEICEECKYKDILQKISEVENG